MILRGSYGLVAGDAFRIEGIYDHAMVYDPPSGLDWANFGGAGLAGQFNGPWSTLVRLDSGVVVVGRNWGQKGFAVNLTFLKFF